MPGTLYLIPSLLDETAPEAILPADVIDKIRQVRFFIVENERTARRFLIGLGMKEYLDDIKFDVLNKHTRKEDLGEMMEPLKEGNTLGLISEAGCPGVADPGAEIVALAHQLNIRVVPFTGPSSILLALMASGLNGQSFAFNGYLPVKPPARIRAIRHFEEFSRREKMTQIFIEAPYRNHQLFQDMIATLNPGTRLCLAINLTGSEERILTKPVAEWRKTKIEFQKKPAVFLFIG